MGYTYGMATTTAVSVVDVIADTLGMSLNQLAKTVGVTEDALLKARGGELHPATVHALVRRLRVSRTLFTRSADSVETLLEVFRIVEPYERIRLVDKFATIRDLLHSICGTVYPPINRPFPHLDLLLDEYDRSEIGGLMPLVAYVRQRLEDDHILVFSHPLKSDDYSAILFVPNKNQDPYSYLIVDMDMNCHPITNALYQWYDVLRILTRVRDWRTDTSWHAVYLERDPRGYDEQVNIRLGESLAVWSRYDYDHIQPVDTHSLSDQYRFLAIVVGLRNGLSPAAVADYYRRYCREVVPPDVENAVRSLANRADVDELIANIVGWNILPLEYDWTIPYYPALLQHAVLLSMIRCDLSDYTALDILDIDGYDMDMLWKQVEQLGVNDTTVPSG